MTTGVSDPLRSVVTRTLAATASDDGTITQVQFFNGATPIVTLTSPPYSATWTGVPVGNYTLTAKATDNLGVVTTSAPASISVQAAAPSGMFFIHPDHLNTPRLITNAAGTAVWRWDNDDPFGNNVPNQNPNGVGTFTCNLRLPGQYFDKETNLFYNYFRDYDPAIGRYVQSDPIGLAGGINTYAYVLGNPLSFVDPLGLQVPIPRPPVPLPTPGTPGTNNRPTGGDVIPFPGGRDRPTDRPSRPDGRPDGRSEPNPCPDPAPLCQFTGIATFESTGGAYSYLLICQYRCPNRGIRYLSNTVYFASGNPAFLCEPAVPEYYFPYRSN